MGIKSIVKKAGIKAADTVNRLSALSPEQLKHIEAQREKYLSEMPDPSDPAAEALTNKLLAVCGVEIFNAYLPQLKDLYVPIKKEVEYEGASMDVSHNIRYFNITKWVKDKKENNIDKLVNVYQVLSNEECNIALIFNRTCLKTNVYLAVANTKNSNNNVDAENYRKRLAEAIKGNCPGAELSECKTGNSLPCFDSRKQYSVGTATNIPTEKSEKFISQTIEKLLDGVVPADRTQEYTLVLLATPILDVEERKLHLSNIYTALAPYASWQTSFQYTESDATNAMAILGVNAGVSAGVQNGVNRSISDAQGEITSKGETTSKSDSKSASQVPWEGGTLKKITEDIRRNPLKAAKSTVLEGGGKFVRDKRLISRTVSDSVTKSLSKVTNKALSTTKTVAEGVAKSTNLGANFGANFARASSITASIGKNEGITQTYTNYNIKHALEVLEEQMKRYEKGTVLGMWDFAAYILSEEQNIANNVAHSYIALTQGDASYMSRSAINLWRGDMGDDSRDAKEIYGYIRELRHPLFGMDPEIVAKDSDILVYPSVVNATTSLSGKELAFSLNFPQKSVVGLPVLECAEFGRNIVTYDGDDGRDNSIQLGHVFHMNHMEHEKINLSSKSLASHTFITGSTGAGKSNTIYQLLDEVSREHIKYLVVEPTKGEYKNVFGFDEDVAVYGTNPKMMPLLRINPFSFPDSIHVLEHIDRLVEIFNVCWPMYAAMPAVLKNAIEKAYEDCGWHLTTSQNEYDEEYHPTFNDVARNVKQIIDISEYDAENKGAYKGALMTRLQSLTNGINGLIFNKKAIPDKDLFDQNVIVDLSRVGSSETKSLLMGMLVLKLQEYRVSEKIGMNSNLRHITVLEEAHHILRRTSSEQTTEGANLLGKSVEMLSNAIAEMRTYGEGFIIADQAPGLVDMAAIRNTNTKIVMRLPDQADREMVGYAANLNGDQIAEVAKLPCGVAAVYQNEWVQPVLCKVKRYPISNKRYSFSAEPPIENGSRLEDRLSIAELLSNGNGVDKKTLRDDIKPKMKELDLDASIQVMAIKMLQNPTEQTRMTRLAPIYHALFPEVTNAISKAYRESQEPRDWTRGAERSIKNLNATQLPDLVKRDMIQCAMTYYLMEVVGSMDDLKRWSELGGFR